MRSSPVPGVPAPSRGGLVADWPLVPLPVGAPVHGGVGLAEVAAVAGGVLQAGVVFKWKNKF